MTPTEYQAAALRTAQEDQFCAENCSAIKLTDAVFAATRATDKLDKFKRALFYDKVEIADRVEILPYNRFALHDPKDDSAEVLKAGLPAVVQRPNFFIHGLIGAATEAGELLELLTGQSEKFNPLEEVGDILWYLNLALTSIGATFEEAMAANIAKLATRYPEKFTTERALNRDLEAEAKALALPTETSAQIESVARLIRENQARKAALPDSESEEKRTDCGGGPNTCGGCDECLARQFPEHPEVLALTSAVLGDK